jgi:hypothetical protein
MSVRTELPIMQRIKGSSGKLVCAKCGKDQFRVPRDESSDPIVECDCSIELGPIFSLRAIADGDAYTPVNAILKR